MWQCGRYCLPPYVSSTANHETGSVIFGPLWGWDGELEAFLTVALGKVAGFDGA